MRLLLAALAALMLLVSTPSPARDNGQYAQADPAIRKWIKGLTDKKGVGCCDMADGYPAEVDWDTDTGKYRVRIEGAWYVVPDDAVLDGPNRLGYAVVWWWAQWSDNEMTPQIRCFLPGAGG